MELFVHLQGISPSGSSNNANEAHTQALINAVMHFMVGLGRQKTGMSTYSRHDQATGEMVVESKVWFSASAMDWDDATGEPTFPTAFQINGDL